MEINFEKGTYYRLGGKVFYLSLLRSATVFCIGIVAVIVLAGVIGYGTAYGQMIFFAGTILFLVYAIGAILFAKYDYACHEFMLDDYALHIRTGVVNRSQMSIPYRQIQDVNIEESYIQRSFGVASLSILTAGHEDAGRSRPGEAGIPQEEAAAFFEVIQRSYADKLEEILMRSSNVQQVVSATPEAHV